MEFIDRQEELRRLRRLSGESLGGLGAVVYGRRRIGKSCLLTKWCQEADGLYWVADTSTPALQRMAFSEAIAMRFPGFDGAVYPTWRSLLQALSQRARLEKWHGPVIFDEFPYLVAADTTFPGVFQAWIDGEFQSRGLLAVISGSSQHMMQGLTLQADAPLYGRAQEILSMKPLAAGHIRSALHLLDAVQAVKAYAIWGGVPRYWQSAERYACRLEESLDDLVLNPLGLYHEEPNFLLQAETPSAIGLRPYLDVIGYGAHRISEMAARLQQPATALSRPVARLTELGLVQRQIPFGESEKSSRRTLYAIGDPLCHLWFHVMAPRRSFFESATPQGRLQMWRRHADAIFAFQWEELCRSLVHRAGRVRELLSGDDAWMPARRWWQENLPEWDVVTGSLSGEVALLGEVKWSEKPFTAGEIRELASFLRRREPPRGVTSTATVRVLMVPVREDTSLSVVDGVIVLTAEDILEASMA